MSIMDELYAEQERLTQDLMDNWGSFKEKNENTEQLLQKMEKQVESNEFKELKNEHVG